MPNSIKRQEMPPNVIHFPVYRCSTESSGPSLGALALLPDRESNNDLIRAYLSEVKVLCLRIETLLAMSDMTEN